MRGDMPEPALRLLCTSQVHTHEQLIYVHPQGSKNAAPITVDGVVYDSIVATKKALHVSSDTIRKWLAEGRAVRG